MWALLLLMVLLFITWILGKYTHILTPRQTRFLQVSSVMYIAIMIFFRSLLLEGSEKDLSDIFLADEQYTVLFLFFLWFLISSSVANALTTNQDYQGFWSDSNDIWISEQDSMPE